MNDEISRLWRRESMLGIYPVISVRESDLQKGERSFFFDRMMRECSLSKISYQNSDLSQYQESSMTQNKDKTSLKLEFLREN